MIDNRTTLENDNLYLDIFDVDNIESSLRKYKYLSYKRMRETPKFKNFQTIGYRICNGIDSKSYFVILKRI